MVRPYEKHSEGLTHVFSLHRQQNPPQEDKSQYSANKKLNTSI